MYMEALKSGLRVIEIPVVFRRRVGTSKGVGANKARAALVAMRMLWLLYRDPSSPEPFSLPAAVRPRRASAPPAA